MNYKLTKSIILFFCVLLLLTPMSADAWISKIGKLAKVSKFAKAGKAAKAVKGLTVMESAHLLFAKIGNKQNRLLLFIGEDSNGILKIASSTGEEFVLKSDKINATSFIDETIKIAETKHDILKTNKKAEIFTSEELFNKYNKTFSQSKQLNNLTIERPNGIRIKTRLVETDNGKVRFAEIHPGLLLKASTISSIDNILWVFKQSIYKSDFKVISLFDETDVIPTNKISSVAGELHTPSKKLLETGLENTIKKCKGKTTFVVGHIEGRHLVIRKADNTISARIYIHELQELSKKHHSNLIVLGCKSGKLNEVTGYLKNIRDMSVIDGLEKALSSRNFGEMFSCFGTVKSPLIFQYATADELALQIKAVRRLETGELAGRYLTLKQLRVTTASKAYVDEMNSRIIWFIPSWVHWTYLSLYILSVFTFQSGWRKLRGYWVVPEFTIGKRLKSIKSHLLRTLTYIVLLPFYTVIFFVLTPFVIIYKCIKYIINLIIRFSKFITDTIKKIRGFYVSCKSKFIS